MATAESRPRATSDAHERSNRLWAAIVQAEYTRVVNEEILERSRTLATRAGFAVPTRRAADRTRANISLSRS